MKLSDLLRPLSGKRISIAIPTESHLKDPEIKSIHYDSRKVTPGGIFVAMTGFHTDGHDHIDDVVGRGAVAVLVDRPVTAPVVAVQVPNTRQSLAALAARFYGYPSRELVVIGITGTNGKTTTSYLIENILVAAGLKVGVIGTINYRFGGKKADAPVTTPEALDLQQILSRMRAKKVTHVIMEVSSHALALNRIDECELDVAVFTNLSQDHLDFHKDMIGYWACKKKLFTEILSTGSKKATARAVINRDDPRGDQLAQELALPVVTVGRGKENSVRPSQVDMGQDGIRGSLYFENNIVGHAPTHMRFHSALAGEFNLENILCAAGACVAVQIDPDAIRAGIEETRSVPGRLERVENHAGIFVYVDYAHTPDALENTLKTLKRMAGGRLICIAGCGGDRDRAKRPRMGRIAVGLSDLTILTSDNPRSEPPMVIIEDMLTGINNGFRPYTADKLPGSTDRPGYVVEPDRRQAIRLGIGVATHGDTVLIAGKGHETYQIIAGRRIPFDDRLEAAKALSQKEAFEPGGLIDDGIRVNCNER